MAFSHCRYLSKDYLRVHWVHLSWVWGLVLLAIIFFLSWRSITGPNFKPGGPANPEIQREAWGVCPPIPNVEKVSEVPLRRVKINVGTACVAVGRASTVRVWIKIYERGGPKMSQHMYYFFGWQMEMWKFRHFCKIRFFFFKIQSVSQNVC